MLIKYGLISSNVNIIDITQTCYTKLIKEGIICIPSDDNIRANYFTDPLFKFVKSIYIIDNENQIKQYDHTQNIYIDTFTESIYTDKDEIPKFIKDIYPANMILEKISKIHQNLTIDFGTLDEEFPEQLMAVKYLTGNEKVLEIGGNIGRNSLVISYILNKNNNNNFVTMECDTDSANKLIHNRDINKLDFFVESSALSKRKLVQKYWDTIVSDEDLEGYTRVSTITFEELTQKYNIDFDTLILDCEGAFYYILIDMPEILTNIKLIIMENDYVDVNHKNYVSDVLKNNGFSVDYEEKGGNWKFYYDNFYQVWKK
uniref:Methyltransferase FkbM domain-containing protein n=1 Tax=viral metagenome TaxID=1070528 RepID=A0A6C0HWG8_9ZZZZ